MDSIELIEQVSRHPSYGIVSYYGRICIHGQWYVYDRVKDQLVRSTKPALQEGLFDGEE
jgi:hypothetical protein